MVQSVIVTFPASTPLQIEVLNRELLSEMRTILRRETVPRIRKLLPKRTGRLAKALHVRTRGNKILLDFRREGFYWRWVDSVRPALRQGVYEDDKLDELALVEFHDEPDSPDEYQGRDGQSRGQQRNQQSRRIQDREQALRRPGDRGRGVARGFRTGGIPSLDPSVQKIVGDYVGKEINKIVRQVVSSAVKNLALNFARQFSGVGFLLSMFS